MVSRRTACVFPNCERKEQARRYCHTHYRQWWEGKELKPIRGTLSPTEKLLEYGWNVTSTGCWEFNGPRAKTGYGRLRVRGVEFLTHRLAHELWVGTIPDGELVRHKCDNPPCINPKHLETGTHLDNARDRMERGRHRGNHRLMQSEVDDIRLAASQNVVNYEHIGEMYGVSKHQVSLIVRNLSWKEQ